MQTRLVKSTVPVAVFGGMILFLGCGAESQKSEPTAGQSAGSAVAAVATPAATNPPLAPVEPGDVPPPAPPQLSPGVDEIVKLAQAGVGDEVLQAYIENSSTTYQLSVEEILYLHDLGLSAETIGALMRHSQANPSTTVAGASAQPSTNNVASATPAPETPPASAPPASGDAAVPPANAYAVTPPQEVNDNYFYQTLSPYGTWLDVADYGWCWQPTVAIVDVGWRPYCNRGRWLWTDCGWYWQSDYSWGWGPFHYGRWYRSPAHGWVWRPDHVWGPAWVTWRYSDSYCGWAPLPPGARFDVGLGFSFHSGHVGVGFDFGLGLDCYSFIPTAYFCDRTPWYHCLPRAQVINVFHHTTVINNYVTGPGHRGIVHVGPGTDAIAKVSRHEIRKVALHDAKSPWGTVIHADRLERDGRTLAVYRPNLPQQASAPPPEITRRQQEVRKQSELLARSEEVRVATTHNERKALVTPVSRTAGGSLSPAPRTPWAVPQPGGQAVEGHASRESNSRNVFSAQPQPSATAPLRPAAISSNSRAERRNGSAQTAPVIVRQPQVESAQRPLAEVAPGTFESQRRERRDWSPVNNPQTQSQPESRPQTRWESPPPRTEFDRSHAPGGQVITPPVSRSEIRKFEAPPANVPPPAVIAPRTMEPRFSSPAYQPPQRAYTPPAAPPSRVIEAPVARPSGPPPSSSPQPAPSSPSSQSRSDGGRKR